MLKQQIVNQFYFIIAVAGILLSSVNLLNGQVIPPDFICVKSDTLIWTLPSNSCGSFNSYTVFVSQNEDGPYEVLAEVTDPNQTNYVHQESVTGQFFYYLQSNFDCPGESVLSSDTLDNRLPELVRMSSLSVNGNNVIIEWEASNSPEVVEYIVYRITPSGTIPIRTVPATELSYTDPDANPNEQQEFYYVLAGDVCGNTSIFPERQGTILMSTDSDACAQAFTLNWNLYENWVNPIEQHEIWVSINNSAAEMVGTAAGNATSFIFEEVNDDTEYCFFIQAVEAITGYRAASNEVCVTADIVQPNRNFFLKSVSVTPDNQVELNWQWDTNAEINQRTVSRSTNDDVFETIDTQTENPPLPPSPTFIDASANVNENVFFYQISTTDDCDTIATSNTVNTVLLTGTPQANQTNLLTWTIPDWESGVVESYELFKIIGDVTERLDMITPPVNSYEDAIDVNNIAEINAQYYLLINISITLPNGQTEVIQVRSNTLRIDQFATIQAPNAFAPNGRNQVFRPVITFGERADYQLLIYDRYGGIVFETNDIKEGWNGRDKSGRLRGSGVYVYHIRIIQPDGSITQDQGTVMLLL